MTTCIGPCVEHAISRSRDLLGYGVTMDDVRAFAVLIMDGGGWPTAHPRAELVPTDQARAGDLLLMAAHNGAGHLAVMLPSGEVEDYRVAVASVCTVPLRRVVRLVVQVWRPQP